VLGFGVPLSRSLDDDSFYQSSHCCVMSRYNHSVLSAFVRPLADGTFTYALSPPAARVLDGKVDSDDPLVVRMSPQGGASPLRDETPLVTGRRTFTAFSEGVAKLRPPPVLTTPVRSPEGEPASRQVTAKPYQPRPIVQLWRSTVRLSQ